MTPEEFIKKYDGAYIGSELGQPAAEMDQFAKDFKEYLANVLPDWELVEYKQVLFSVSGCLKRGEDWINFSYYAHPNCSTNRGPNNFTSDYYGHAVKVSYGKDVSYINRHDFCCTVADLAAGVEKVANAKGDLPWY